MTVHYTDKVASRGGFGSFWKLLLKWRGSVYKMVWQDMLLYIVLYYTLSLLYRFAFPSDLQRMFERLVIHCSRFRNLIPVSFVLGFFVSLVVNRWWGVYQTLPFPDNTAILTATHIPGQNAAAREARSTILRYVNLTIALTFTIISPVVKRKHPTLNSLVMAGFLTESEQEILETLKSKSSVHNAWAPILWACKTVDRAKRDGLVSDAGQRAITAEIITIRAKCGGLLGWHEYNVPLVYTQVVTIAVYSFFFFSVLGEQFLRTDQGYANHTIDLYIPIFALLQLFFYVGWIKVAEALLNPFGEDDNDFEFVPLLTRHVEMSRLLSEPSPSELPEKVRDIETEAPPVKINYANEDETQSNTSTD
ncbi:bestrophin-2 [Procambarus clarkii]|uniref:bestrophin-2 n=1 Tax=Procambarus clarkii TaxID=6728 RepID=UPI001E676741|nr:bestrophin-2-like [Procambarus clarkii]